RFVQKTPPSLDPFGWIDSPSCERQPRRCAEHRCVSAIREQCAGREHNCCCSQIDEKDFSHRVLLDRGILPGTHVQHRARACLTREYEFARAWFLEHSQFDENSPASDCSSRLKRGC